MSDIKITGPVGEGGDDDSAGENKKKDKPREIKTDLGRSEPHMKSPRADGSGRASTPASGATGGGAIVDGSAGSLGPQGSSLLGQSLGESQVAMVKSAATGTPRGSASPRALLVSPRALASPRHNIDDGSKGDLEKRKPPKKAKEPEVAIIVDTSAMLETPTIKDAFLKYCAAFAKMIPPKKPFVFSFATLCYIGREKYDQEVVVKMRSDFLIRCGKKTFNIVPAFKIRSPKFKDGEPKEYWPEDIMEESDHELIHSVILRMQEFLRFEIIDEETGKRQMHRLELSLPGIGRITIPEDRVNYTFIRRVWEPLHFVIGREAKNPEDLEDMEEILSGEKKYQVRGEIIESDSD